MGAKGSLMPRADALPPRLMNMDAAASYVGLSPNQFMEEVNAGTFPGPFKLKKTRRVLWDRMALDRALDRAAGFALDTDHGRETRKARWRARNENRQEATV